MKYILIVLMFINSVVHGQKLDTVRAMLLVCDTTHGLLPNGFIRVGEYDSILHGFLTTPDSSYKNPNERAYWIFGYSVMEKHNEQEWQIDWYFDHKRPPQDYYISLNIYLDKKKKPLSKNIIVWQSKTLNTNE